jgi:probable HAF family extracellular repeat protein
VTDGWLRAPAGTFTGIGTSSPYTGAGGINDVGQIVGWNTGPGTSTVHGFLYSDPTLAVSPPSTGTGPGTGAGTGTSCGVEAEAEDQDRAKHAGEDLARRTGQDQDKHESQDQDSHEAKRADNHQGEHECHGDDSGAKHD